MPNFLLISFSFTLAYIRRYILLMDASITNKIDFPFGIFLFFPCENASKIIFETYFFA